MEKNKTSTQKDSKFIIIGAGLSGLVTAYKLLTSGEKNFMVLEAKPYSGGRILSENNIDLGPTWFQNYHTHLIDLLNELEVENFEQFKEGRNTLVYSTSTPPHYFESDLREPAANRISGGSVAVINKLTQKLKSYIQYEVEVNSFSEENDLLVLKTNKGNFGAKKVVNTLPPKLASTLAYSPALSKPILEFMDGVHTWMSNSIKAGVTFKTPFWREKGFSGMMVGQISPMIELYDHSSADGKSFSLMGFVNEGLRNRTPDARRDLIINYLAEHLGEEALDYLTYSEKDWSLDKYTSTENIEAPYGHPSYGHPIFQEFHLGGKLLFSGTETSQVYGGYMEGAVYSGINAFKLLMEV